MKGGIRKGKEEIKEAVSTPSKPTSHQGQQRSEIAGGGEKRGEW
jgi:hypothetical protein